MYFKKYGEQPADAGTRKLAAKLSMQGFHAAQGSVYDPREPYCDKPVHVYRYVRPGGYDRSVEVSMLRPCRKCPKCLQFRQMKWRYRCLRECNRAPRTWFVTLTFSPVHLAGVLAEAHQRKGGKTDRGIDDAAYKHVSRYLKRLRKASKAKLRYFAVFERGDLHGRPHYHLLIHEVNKPITKRTITENWISFVGCKLVVADEAGGSASYITKYATKSVDIRLRASVRYGTALPFSA